MRYCILIKIKRHLKITFRAALHNGFKWAHLVRKVKESVTNHNLANIWLAQFISVQNKTVIKLDCISFNIWTWFFWNYNENGEEGEKRCLIRHSTFSEIYHHATDPLKLIYLSWIVFQNIPIASRPLYSRGCFIEECRTFHATKTVKSIAQLILFFIFLRKSIINAFQISFTALTIRKIIY